MPPSPFKSRTVKRTKRPSADVDRTVAVHNDVEIAQQAGAAHLAAAAPSYAADARSLPSPLQSRNDKRAKRSSAVGKRGVDARIESAETISCVIKEEGCIFLFTLLHHNLLPPSPLHNPFAPVSTGRLY